MHAPSTSTDPARQAEQVSCDRVDVALKLSIPPAVHFAGRAAREKLDQELISAFREGTSLPSHADLELS